MPPGLHAHLAIDPPGPCPVADLTRRTRVTHYRPGEPGEFPAQVVFLTPDDGVPLPRVFDVVVASETLTIARLPSDAPDGVDPSAGADATGSACASASGCCLAWLLGHLPAEPYAIVWDDGSAHLYFAVESSVALTEVLESVRRRGFTVHVRQVSSEETDTAAPVHVIWLDDLTERQIEVMSVAVEMGYFDPNGASAAEVADRIGIAKSTLSGHLRVASEKILSNLF